MNLETISTEIEAVRSWIKLIKASCEGNIAPQEHLTPAMRSLWLCHGIALGHYDYYQPREK
jgi:hypothetical protein